MKRQTSILSLFFVSVSLITVSVIGSQSTDYFAYAGINNNKWYHYNKVNNTYDTKGCKEYWTNCAGTTLTTKPAVSESEIVNMGSQSQKWIDELNDNDERLIKPARELLSFENTSEQDLITSRRNNFASKTIIDGESTHGNKCLKLTYKDSTADFQLPIDYLDNAFSDPNVVAINFDAKGSENKTYFCYYLNGKGVSYENFEAINFGLTTEWKTFSYPREAYNACKTGTWSKNAMLWTTCTAYSTAIYLDNIHAVTRIHDSYGLEGFRLIDRNTSSDYLKRASIRDSSNKEPITVISTTETNYGFDYDVKSEGNRSLKIHKNSDGDLTLLLPIIAETLSDDEVVSFDLYTTESIDSNSIFAGIQTGNGKPLSMTTTYQHKADRWVTYNFRKTDFNDEKAILKIIGNTECDVYFDNFRVNNNSLNKEGFENYSISKSQEQIYTINGNQDDNLNREDYELRIEGNNSVGYLGYSKSIKSEGNQSLRIQRTNSEGSLVFNVSQEMLEIIKDDKAILSFDLYSNVNAYSTTLVSNLCDGYGNRISDHDISHESYKWNTYTLDSSHFNGTKFLMIRDNTVGDWFIDNIRLIKPSIPKYSNGRTAYIGVNTPSKVFRLSSSYETISEVKIDDVSISLSLVTMLDSTSFAISNSAFLTSGRKTINVTYEKYGLESEDIISCDVVLLNQLSDEIDVDTSYGATDYTTTSIDSSDYFRIVYGEYEVPYQVDSSNKIMFPNAALVSLLSSKDGKKESGSLELGLIGLSKQDALTINVNLIGDRTEKHIEQFNGDGISTYAYSSFSSYVDYNTYEEYVSDDTIIDFDNTGLDYMYLQTCQIGYSQKSIHDAHEYIFNIAGKYGKKVMVVDSVLSILSKEESSLIGRDIVINAKASYSLRFNTTSELDEYVEGRLKIVTDCSNCYGLTIGDEPTYNQLMGGCKDLMPSIKRGLNNLGKPDFGIHLNLLPMNAGKLRLTGSEGTSQPESDYETYLNAYESVVGNDFNFVQYDLYALADSSKNNDTYDNGKGLNSYTLLNLLVAANYAKKHNKQLRVVTQSFTYKGTGDRIFTHSDLLFLNNMLVSFGVKNIAYFVYQNRKDAGSSSEAWLDTQEFLTVEGEKNNTYYYMTSVLAQINAFEHVISSFEYDWSHLYSGSVFTRNSAKMYSRMTGSTYYNSSESYNSIKSVSVSQDWTLMTGLVSKNDSSKYMYSFQNVYNSFGANLLQKINIKFTKEIDYLVIYEAGLPMVMNVDGKELEICLSSGNAAYFLNY